MKETEGLYADAEKAYTSTGDWENVIRINLKYLDNPDKAREILMNYCKIESDVILMNEYYESRAYKNEEELMPLIFLCQFCKKDVPEYDLKCNGCYNMLPFCIASGKHIVLKGLSKCPNCNFP